jgi:hypothetical protein
MKRLRKQLELGVRWLDCGWRLFKRNPWLLLGMALVSMVIVILAIARNGTSIDGDSHSLKAHPLPR